MWRLSWRMAAELAALVVVQVLLQWGEEAMVVEEQTAAADSVMILVLV